ncbi:small ribosomal subunit protein mS33 [Centruroides vittatus]|uniref:small ribosomal subunit protein mS33 n=1 Tax=Centruroides vittatus TaxID=120091 RepID=UPI003510B5E3
MASGSSMSNYAKRMAYLSARIFGEVARPTNSKSMKVVKLYSERPVDLREEIINWYPPHPQIRILMWRLRDYGLFRDEHQDFKDEMKRLRELRGKGKPKRGEGKRAKLSKSSES